MKWLREIVRRVRARFAAALRHLADRVDWPHAEGCDWHPLVGGPAPESWLETTPCSSVQPSEWLTWAHWSGDPSDPRPPRPRSCSRPLNHPGPWHVASDGKRLIAAWTGEVETWA